MAYTTVNKGTDYFNTLLYSGTGSTNAVTGVGFQPDWIWIKQRTGNTPHKIFDSLRGTGKSLKSNSNDAEATNEENGYVSAFGSNGFTLTNGSTSPNDVNAGSGSKYTAWNWKCNGGTTSTNSNGTISSTVQVNSTAGFSIVKWTGDGSESATVGHGLGAELNLLITKEMTGGDWWHNVQTGMSSSSHNMFFNVNNGERVPHNDGHLKLLSNTTTFGFDSSTSNVNAVNHSGIDNIAYCFKNVKGFSKFGSYKGNGDAANGPFVYLGFKPAFVMTKRTDSTGDWAMMDNKRPGNYNVVQNYFKAQAADSEQTDDSFNIDILSNGFKIKYNNTNYNASGGSYVYMAWAEAPLVGTNNVPATAR